MSPHRPAETPPVAASGRDTLDDLISQARTLRRGVEDVRRAATPPGGAQPASEAERRWREAVCDLAVSQLDDLHGQLHQLRDGVSEPSATAAPEHDAHDAGAAYGGPAARGEPGSLIGRVGSGDWNLLTDEVTWSQELYRIFGRTEDDGPLSLDELPAWVFPEDTPALTAAFTDCLVDGRPLDGEFRINRPDGGVRTLHMTGEPVLDADGGTSSMWAVLRDVSALRRTEHAAREHGERWRSERGDDRAEAQLAAALRESVVPPWRGTRRLPAARGTGARTAAVTPGCLEVAALHLAAGSASGTGGCWYEAGELPEGDVLLSTGELTGHGVSTATGVATLLGALRGMALAGVEPGLLMAHLNRLVDASAQPAMGSALFCRWDAAARTLTWAQAGHPAPVLFRGGSGRRLPHPEGLLLGVNRDARYGTAAELLERGDLLVFHTENLTPPDGTAGLAGLAPRLTVARTPQECLRVVAEEFGGPRGEDACLLVARVT